MNVGRVYMYTTTDGVMWSEAAVVHASDETEGAGFGSSVFIEGSIMVVGASVADTIVTADSGRFDFCTEYQYPTRILLIVLWCRGRGFIFPPPWG